MNRKRIIIGIVCVIAGIAVWLGYQKYRDFEPVYALLQIKESYEKHDVELFKKHVAIGSIINSAIDQVMKQNVQPAADNAWVAGGMAVASDLLNLIKPRVSETIEAEVYQAIETGKLELENSGDLAITSLKKASEPFLEGTYRFDSIEDVERSGGEAKVTLKFSPDYSSEPFLLQCRMQKINGEWKLTEILNAAELMKLHEKRH